MTSRFFSKFLKSSNSLSLSLFIVIFLFSCEREEVVPVEIEQLEESSVLPGGFEIVQFTDLGNYKKAVDQLASEFPESKGGSILDEVDFGSALKRYDEESGITHYSFSMKSGPNTFRNFLLRENTQGDIWGHILEFEVNAESNVIYESRPDLEEFNGWFKLLRLDGTVLVEDQLVAGKSTAKKYSEK